MKYNELSAESYYIIQEKVKKIYGSMLSKSKERGHTNPNFSMEELYEWIITRDNIKELYGDWLNSGFNKMKVLSCDRLNNEEGYSFKNIELVSWEENSRRYLYDMYNGINNNATKPILKINPATGEIEEEILSAAIAMRKYGYSTKLGCALNKRRLSYKGYIWIFKEDYHEEYIEDLIEDFNNTKGVRKAILALDEEQNIIKEYKTIADASRDIGVSVPAIRNALTGKTNKSGDLYWAYKNYFNS